MSINRPNNINKRLTGTPSCTPGNAGQIGPVKTPYCGRKLSDPKSLGQRFFSGPCSGIFKINESYCGRREDCQCGPIDCKGFFICCGPGSTKWFVAPSCTQVSRTWYSRNDAITVVNSCMGSCGWFIPDLTQSQNPGYTCRTYWGTCTGLYWTNSEASGNHAWRINMDNGNTYGADSSKFSNFNIRTFRCTAS